MAEQIKKFHFDSTKRTNERTNEAHKLALLSEIENVGQIAKKESKNRNIDIDAGNFIGLCQFSFGLA